VTVKVVPFFGEYAYRPSSNEMLLEQTMERLNAIKLFGMAKVFREWNDAPRKQEARVAEFVGFLAAAEWVSRENRKLQLPLAAARFKLNACIEDIDYAHPQ
jgi:hypothetical protein